MRVCWTVPGITATGPVTTRTRSSGGIEIPGVYLDGVREVGNAPWLRERAPIESPLREPRSPTEAEPVEGNRHATVVSEPIHVLRRPLWVRSSAVIGVETRVNAISTARTTLATAYVRTPVSDLRA